MMGETLHLGRWVKVGICVAILFLTVGLSQALADSGPQPAQAACVPGPHTGVISADQLWCAEDGAHVLTNDVTIAPGVVVTVTAGATVQGASSVALIVQGELQALGTASQPITFTSTADTGTAQWSGLAFDGGVGYLSYATVRYAGNRNSLSDSLLGASHRAAITARNSVLTLENATVRDVLATSVFAGHDYGLIASDTTVVLSGTLFTTIGGDEYAESDVPIILMGPLTTISLSDCILSGNENDRILLAPGTLMGHQNALLPAGAIMDGYEFREDYTVPATVTLTIEPGVSVFSGIGSWNVPHDLVVEGRLVALGTPTLPITFTSVADSSPGQWNGLSFDATGGGPGEGQLAYVTVRNAGRRNRVSDALLGAHNRAGITVREGTLSLDNVTIRDVQTTDWEKGILLANGQISVQHSLFTGIGNGEKDNSESADAPIHVIGGDSRWFLDDNQYVDNSPNMIKVAPEALTGDDLTLFYQDGLDGYLFQGDFVVPVGITMTLEPGVAYRGDVGDALCVEGNLVAQGTPTQPITFTSYADTGPDQWAGLVFDGGLGQLARATVRYAGDRNYLSDALLGAYNQAAITVREGTLSLDNVTIRDMQTTDWDKGILLANSQITVQHSLFTGIGNGEKDNSESADAPIHVIGADSRWFLDDNQYVDNSPNMIKVAPEALTGQDFTLFYQDGLDGYLFQDDFVVPVGITMTLEPGVTYHGDFGDELRIEGNLVAQGTATQPITFTSYADSSPHCWSGLVFDGRGGQGSGDLRHATVRYAGSGNSILETLGDGYFRGTNITAYGVVSGTLYLEDVVIERMYHFDGWHNFADAGLYLQDSRAMLQRTVLRENGDRPEDDDAIRVLGASRLLVRESSIESNSGKGIEIVGDEAFVQVTGSRIANNLAEGVRNNGAATVILSAAEESGNIILANVGYGARQMGTVGQILATHNWWGDATGPTHAANPGGSGEPVSDRVLYDPWLTASPTPPAVELRLVQAAVPQRTSVGQVVNIGVLAENVYAYTLEDVVVVLEIAPQSVYRYSSAGGRFWPQQNHVIWNLGDLEPGDTFAATVQVWYRWGIPNFTVMPVRGLLAAANLENEYLAYALHRDYVEITTVSEEDLDATQVAAALAADADLNALYQHVLSQGYQFYGNATQRTLSNGVEELTLLLLDPARLGEMAAVQRTDGQHLIRLETGQYIAYYDLEGGAQFDLATARWSFWGDRVGDASGGAGACGIAGAQGECPDHDWGDCLRNCLINQVPHDMLDASRSSSSSCRACQACTGDCLGVCSQCARDMWNKDKTNDKYSDCTDRCDDSNNWNSQQCDGSSEQCWDAPVNESKYSTSQYMVRYECDGNSCQYDPNPILLYCPYGCDMGDTTAGIDTRCKELDCDSWLAFLDVHCSRSLTAHDPNALYGPLTAAPGQTLSYTVETENEGEAPAYDVFVEAALPPELDAATLAMSPGGIYFPGSRTMFWTIGELQPGVGSTVTFTVGLPAGVVSGTVVTAQAAVHFPSVPEITPTNPVVTLVQDVAAHEQTVQVAAGEAVTITLSGSSSSGGALTFTVVEAPWQGTLAGVAPTLVYTADAKAAGMDQLTFTVSDGTQTSLPAMVTIQIAQGQETDPPQVLAVSPVNGADGVTAGDVEIYANVYPPSVWAQFDEPMDPESLTAEHVSLVNASLQPVAFSLYYSEDSRRLYLELNEPLRYETTYTVTLGTGLQDLSGNPLAEEYSWSFTTGPEPPEEWFVRLPIVRIR